MKIQRVVAVLAGCVAVSASTGLEADPHDAGSAAVTVVKRSASGAAVPSEKVAFVVDGKLLNLAAFHLTEENGQLLVPPRPIAEALGASVTVDAAGTTLTVATRTRRLTIQTGGALETSRLVMPLRSLCDALGARLTVAAAGPQGIRQIELRSEPGSALPPGPRPVVIAPHIEEPATPVSGGSQAAAVQHNLAVLNAYRAQAGIGPLKLDALLSSFAQAGSAELMKNHLPHHHFASSNVWANGFRNGAGENQGDPHGWIPGPLNTTIDDILKMMIGEGPGGGHHDNIMNPHFTRLGVGLVKDGQGRLYLTNDFSQG